MKNPTKQNVSARIWALSLNAVNKRLKGAHVKRDAYIEELLSREIELLATEIKDRNPAGAKSQINESLRKLPKSEKCSLSLDSDLVKRINEVLAERDISRNAFFNRVFFLLVAKPIHLKALEIGFVRHESIEASPLLDAAGFLFDPFFSIRQSNNDRLYSLVFPKLAISEKFPSLFGLNCYIDPDEWVAVRSVEDIVVSLDDI